MLPSADVLAKRVERVRATCAQGAAAVRVLPEEGHSAWHGQPLVVALR